MGLTATARLKTYEAGNRLEYSGDIKTLIKAIKLLNERQLGFPGDSHHGTYIRLVDYKAILRIANKNDHMLLILQKEDWAAVISKDGYSGNTQPGIPIEMKEGFIMLLKKLGYTIVSKWNDDNVGTSVSVVVSDDSLDNPNPTFFNDKKIAKNFVEELENYFEILRKLK